MSPSSSRPASLKSSDVIKATLVTLLALANVANAEFKTISLVPLDPYAQVSPVAELEY